VSLTGSNCNRFELPAIGFIRDYPVWPFWALDQEPTPVTLRKRNKITEPLVARESRYTIVSGLAKRSSFAVIPISIEMFLRVELDGGREIALEDH
jgi:hypothetical protein